MGRMKNPDKEMKHKEAYCWMQYRCDKCNHQVPIWNSRDGVTPFTTSCFETKGCDGTMYHVQWDQDKRNRLTELEEGDLVWTSITEEQARRSYHKLYDQFIDKENYSSSQISEMVETAVADDVRNGAPWLNIVVNSEYSDVYEKFK